MVGFIGVQLQTLSENVRRQLGYTGDGALIAGVIANSAADHAGLNPGDVIQQVNGTDVKSVNDVLAAMKPRLHLFGHHHEFTDSVRQSIRSIGLDVVTKSYLLIDAVTLRTERLDT